MGLFSTTCFSFDLFQLQNFCHWNEIVVSGAPFIRFSHLQERSSNRGEIKDFLKEGNQKIKIEFKNYNNSIDEKTLEYKTKNRRDQVFNILTDALTSVDSSKAIFLSKREGCPSPKAFISYYQDKEDNIETDSTDILLASDDPTLKPLLSQNPNSSDQRIAVIINPTLPGTNLPFANLMQAQGDGDFTQRYYGYQEKKICKVLGYDHYVLNSVQYSERGNNEMAIGFENFEFGTPILHLIKSTDPNNPQTSLNDKFYFQEIVQKLVCRAGEDNNNPKPIFIAGVVSKEELIFQDQDYNSGERIDVPALKETDGHKTCQKFGFERSMVFGKIVSEDAEKTLGVKFESNDTHSLVMGLPLDALYCYK